MDEVKVLIVDDKPLLHEVYTIMLSKDEKIKIIGNCYDGVDVLKFLKSNATDVIILDIMMPTNGMEIIPLIRENHPEIKIIVITFLEEDWYYRDKIYELGISSEYCLSKHKLNEDDLIRKMRA